MPMIEANIDPSVDPNAEVARKALSGVLRRFENEELAEAWLVTRRWPSGVRCPRIAGQCPIAAGVVARSSASNRTVRCGRQRSH